MKIAITGAKGKVGSAVVKLCHEQRHSTVQIDLVDGESEGPDTIYKKVDTAGDYDGLVEAFGGADAVIHLAAIPNPLVAPDAIVHNNNVNSAFNGFRAAAENGIKKIMWASSVNAIGLGFANQKHTHFDYFPLDEETPQNPTDAYALAKMETEVQARAFVNWFPGTKIGCLRLHQVASREEVAEQHMKNFEEKGTKQLWGWVHPAAVARACLAVVEQADGFEGCEVFNVHAPTIAHDMSSRDLAQKYHPNTELRNDFGEKERSQGFWSTAKIERVLGWRHTETE